MSADCIQEFTVYTFQKWQQTVNYIRPVSYLLSSSIWDMSYCYLNYVFKGQQLMSQITDSISFINLISPRRGETLLCSNTHNLQNYDINETKKGVLDGSKKYSIDLLYHKFSSVKIKWRAENYNLSLCIHCMDFSFCKFNITAVALKRSLIMVFNGMIITK